MKLQQQLQQYHLNFCSQLIQEIVLLLPILLRVLLVLHQVNDKYQPLLHFILFSIFHFPNVVYDPQIIQLHLNFHHYYCSFLQEWLYYHLPIHIKYYSLLLILLSKYFLRIDIRILTKTSFFDASQRRLSENQMSYKIQLNYLHT